MKNTLVLMQRAIREFLQAFLQAFVGKLHFVHRFLLV